MLCKFDVGDVQQGTLPGSLPIQWTSSSRSNRMIHNPLLLVNQLTQELMRALRNDLQGYCGHEILYNDTFTNKE